MPTAQRNWRLEILAWAAAIALVAAALVFSSGSDDTAETPPTPEAPPVETAPFNP